MKKPLILFLLVYLSVVIINDGFMASDEYWTAMTRYLPAQQSNLNTLVHEDDVKSAVQILPMHAMAQLASQLGISSAYGQYRFVIASLAFINIGILLYALILLGQILTDDKGWTLATCALYFAAPFALTRPMFESLATPWLFMSLVLAMRYDLSGQQRKDLLWAGVMICIGFLLRPQVGLCGLALLIPPIRHKKWNDLLSLAAVGAVGFLLAGLPDIYFRGKYHYSFLAVTVYNFEHGHEYGNEPWTYYPLMIMALTAFPFFIYSYGKSFWQKYFHEQYLNFAFIFLFVLLHSLFPQKFERFLIPLIPCLALAMAPLLRHLYAEKQKRKIRWYSLITLNFILFIPASYSPAQKNIIDLALDLNSKPQVRKVYSVDESITWIPDLFIADPHPEIIQIQGSAIQDLDPNDCNIWIVANEGLARKYKGPLFRYTRLKTYNVNYLEKAAYLLNRKNNLRRSPLEVYSCTR